MFFVHEPWGAGIGNDGAFPSRRIRFLSVGYGGGRGRLRSTGELASPMLCTTLMILLLLWLLAMIFLPVWGVVIASFVLALAAAEVVRRELRKSK